MYFSEYKGIYFVEGLPAGAERFVPINTEINSIFGHNQLKSLNDVKDRLVSPVREAGGNAVVNFQYGQRSSFWKSLFGMDDVYWYASGEIARIDPAALKKD